MVNSSRDPSIFCVAPNLDWTLWRSGLVWNRNNEVPVVLSLAGKVHSHSFLLQRLPRHQALPQVQWWSNETCRLEMLRIQAADGQQLFKEAGQAHWNDESQTWDLSINHLNQSLWVNLSIEYFTQPCLTFLHKTLRLIHQPRFPLNSRGNSLATKLPLSLSSNNWTTDCLKRMWEWETPHVFCVYISYILGCFGVCWLCFCIQKHFKGLVLFDLHWEFSKVFVGCLYQWQNVLYQSRSCFQSFLCWTSLHDFSGTNPFRSFSKVIFACFMYTNLQEKLSIHLVVWKTWKQTSPTNRRSWIEGYGLSKPQLGCIPYHSMISHQVPTCKLKCRHERNASSEPAWCD